MPCDQCTDPDRCNRFGVCQQFRHTLPAGSYEQRIKEPMTDDDVFTLVGYATVLRDKGQNEMQAYFFGLALRIADHLGDPELVRRMEELANFCRTECHHGHQPPDEPELGFGEPEPAPDAGVQAGVPLSDEQIDAIAKQTFCKGAEDKEGAWGPGTVNATWLELIGRPIARAVEAAHGIGVTVAPAPAGKPPEDSYPDQTILHAEGECGNCLQATIAGVLGWPLAAVPHFALLGEDHWWDCAQAWLNSQGYWIDYQPTSYAAEGGELMPRCWLSGRSPRGFSHAVVGDSATLQVLHDPHPSRAGLVEHSYTIYFFRKPTAGVGGNCHQTFPHEPPMKDSP